MAKHILEIDYEEEFDIFCISSQLKDYRMCWLLNKCFNWQLKKVDNHIGVNKKNQRSSHSHFLFEDNENHLEYHFVSNKSPEGVLWPEYKQSDYFLVLFNNDLLNPETIEHRMRKIDGILAVVLSSSEEMDASTQANFIFN